VSAALGARAWIAATLLLTETLLLTSCGGARPPAPAPIAAPEPETVEVASAPPAPIALTLGMLTLATRPSASSSTRETRPPVTAEMVNDAGELTGTRCGATSLSADGVLRRDDQIVAQLSPTADGFALLDGEGHDTHLVVREHRIVTTSGELRFRRDTDVIVSPLGDVPATEITLRGGTAETALALFATLLVCNDLGP
jgi:hypothetical protein